MGRVEVEHGRALRMPPLERQDASHNAPPEGFREIRSPGLKPEDVRPQACNAALTDVGRRLGRRNSLWSLMAPTGVGP